MQTHDNIIIFTYRHVMHTLIIMHTHCTRLRKNRNYLHN